MHALQITPPQIYKSSKLDFTLMFAINALIRFSPPTQLCNSVSLTFEAYSFVSGVSKYLGSCGSIVPTLSIWTCNGYLALEPVVFATIIKQITMLDWYQLKI